MQITRNIKLLDKWKRLPEDLALYIIQFLFYDSIYCKICKKYQTTIHICKPMQYVHRFICYKWFCFIQIPKHKLTWKLLDALCLNISLALLIFLGRHLIYH